MMGFRARALNSAIALDVHELEDARWFTREGIVRELREGRIELPRRVSIAYRLVEDWFDSAGGARLADLVSDAGG